MFRLPDSSFSYRPIGLLQSGDVVAALREWRECVVEIEDRERVDALLRECESSIDIVVVSKNSSIASERGTSFEGGPAGGDSAGGDVS